MMLGFVADTVIMFTTQLLFFIFGYLFFMLQLFSNYEVCYSELEHATWQCLNLFVQYNSYLVVDTSRLNDLNVFFLGIFDCRLSKCVQYILYKCQKLLLKYSNKYNLYLNIMPCVSPQIHQRGVQVLFAVTFTMSLSMFELIIFEILGVMDLSSRLFHWKLNLYFALVLLIVVLPMYMSYIVLNSLRYVILYNVYCISLLCILYCISLLCMLYFISLLWDFFWVAKVILLFDDHYIWVFIKSRTNIQNIETTKTYSTLLFSVLDCLFLLLLEVGWPISHHESQARDIQHRADDKVSTSMW